MIITTHHMPLAWDFVMMYPHHEDWLGWQGQVHGKQRLLGWDSQGRQFEGEHRLGSCALTGGTSGGAKIANSGICVTKIEIQGRRFVPYL